MRLLTINTDCSSGGAARVASTLHNYVRRNPRIHCVYLTGRHSRTPNDHIINLHPTPIYEYANTLIYRFFAKEGVLSKHLWDNIQDYFLKSDTVHLHNAHGYYLPESVLESIAHQRLIWTLHDFWIATGRCTFPLECSGWTQICRYCPHLDRYPRTFFKRDFSRSFSWKRNLLHSLTKALLIVPSYSFLNELLQLGISKNNVMVIHNGIDITIFRPLKNLHEKNLLKQKLNLPQDARPVVCFVARRIFEPRKGFHIFYETLLSIRTQIVLIIIGEGSLSINKFRIPNNVELICVGHMHNLQLLSDYLRVTDIFVNPSQSETFGLTSLEALSCGARPVVFNLPIFHEILSEWAIITRENNLSSFADALLESLVQPLSFNDKDKAYQYICDNFSVHNMCQKYMKLYSNF